MSSIHSKDVLSTKEAPFVESGLVTLKPEEAQQKQKLSGKISVPTKVRRKQIILLLWVSNKENEILFRLI